MWSFFFCYVTLRQYCILILRIHSHSFIQYFQIISLIWMWLDLIALLFNLINFWTWSSIDIAIFICNILKMWWILIIQQYDTLLNDFLVMFLILSNWLSKVVPLFSICIIVVYFLDDSSNYFLLDYDYMISILYFIYELIAITILNFLQPFFILVLHHTSNWLRLLYGVNVILHYNYFFILIILIQFHLHSFLS